MYGLEMFAFRRMMTLANSMSRIAGLKGFLVLHHKTDQLDYEPSMRGWVGVPSPKTKLPNASHNAMWFEAEAAYHGAASNGLVVIPTSIVRHPKIHARNGGVHDNGFSVGFVFQPGPQNTCQNTMVASVILYGLQHPLSLHHFGVRRVGANAARSNVQRLYQTRKYGKAVRLPADDHIRHYLWDPRLECYYEVQEWESGWRGTMHWDFIVEDPESFLQYIGHICGVEPVLFNDHGAYDPFGVVWIKDQRGHNIMGVMARDRYWTVPGLPR